MAKVQSVAAYLAALQQPHRGTLEKLRADILAAEPRLEETISYNIPTYKLGAGYGIVSFAAFKNHCSLFPMSSSAAGALGLEVSGQSTLQFPPDTPPSAALVKRIIKYRLQENAALKAKRAAKKAEKQAAKKAEAKKPAKKR